MSANLVNKPEARKIRYPLRVQNSIEMITFMLNDAGMKTFRHPRNALAAY